MKITTHKLPNRFKRTKKPIVSKINLFERMLSEEIKKRNKTK
jgi:hypothetical protein